MFFLDIVLDLGWTKGFEKLIIRIHISSDDFEILSFIPSVPT